MIKSFLKIISLFVLTISLSSSAKAVELEFYFPVQLAELQLKL